MMMEFIILHSGMFMGGVAGAAESIWKRYLIFSGLLLFYSVLALIFAATVDSIDVLGIYGFMISTLNHSDPPSLMKTDPPKFLQIPIA